MFYQGRHIVLNQRTTKFSHSQAFIPMASPPSVPGHEGEQSLRTLSVETNKILCFKANEKKQTAKYNSHSNSILLMNIKTLILHSWQVSVRLIMEICGCSTSGVRTRAIKIK